MLEEQESAAATVNERGRAGRSAALDVLRFVAVMLVMVRHIRPRAPEGWPEWARGAMGSFRAGWIGVDLFFVLSGFLVSGLIFAEFAKRGSVDFPRFIARRALRIYPPFFVFLAITVAVQHWWLGAPVGLTGPDELGARLWPELLFVQSYFWGYWNHTWTLAVEEHFYVLLPLVAFVVLRVRGRDERDVREIARRGSRVFAPLVPVFVVIASAALVWRLSNAVERPPETRFGLLTHLTPSHLRMDSLFAGVVLAYLWHHFRGAMVMVARRIWWLILMLSAAGIGSVVARPLQDSYVLTWGLSVLAWSFAGVLWIVVAAEERGVFARLSRAVVVSAAAFLGTCSYSIYLWHRPARNWGEVILSERYLEVAPGSAAEYVWLAMFTLVGGIGLGVLASLLIERPVLRWRDWFVPSRSAGVHSCEALKVP